MEELDLSNVKIVDHQILSESKSPIEKKIEAAEKAVKFTENYINIDQEEGIDTVKDDYQLGAPNESKKILSKRSNTENIVDSIMNNTSFQPPNDKLFTSQDLRQEQNHTGDIARPATKSVLTANSF